MRKMLIVSILTLAGLLVSGGKASAFWYGWWTCGYPAFCGYPYLCGGPCPGGCYFYAPYYGWYAYYGYSHSPYAWPHGYVAGNYPAYVPGMTDRTPTNTTGNDAPAEVTATLPADAVLLFNGTAASGATGELRSFQTTPLKPGQVYEYTVTARITRNGQTETVSERVMVKAGEKTSVSLMPKSDPSRVAAK